MPTEAPSRRAANVAAVQVRGTVGTHSVLGPAGLCEMCGTRRKHGGFAHRATCPFRGVLRTAAHCSWLGCDPAFRGQPEIGMQGQL